MKRTLPLLWLLLCMKLHCSWKNSKTEGGSSTTVCSTKAETKRPASNSNTIRWIINQMKLLYHPTKRQQRWTSKYRRVRKLNYQDLNICSCLSANSGEVLVQIFDQAVTNKGRKQKTVRTMSELSQKGTRTSPEQTRTERETTSDFPRNESLMGSSRKRRKFPVSGCFETGGRKDINEGGNSHSRGFDQGWSRKIRRWKRN